MLHLTAKLDPDCESESLNCYTAYINDDNADESIDFWFPKKERPTSMDIHVEFDRGDDSDGSESDSVPEKITATPYCWVCRSRHELEANKCPAMQEIA